MSSRAEHGSSAGSVLTLTTRDREPQVRPEKSEPGMRGRDEKREVKSFRSCPVKSLSQVED